VRFTPDRPHLAALPPRSIARSQNTGGRMRRGRKRKLNVQRTGCGKSRGESAEEIMAVALGQPHRRFARTPREAKLGYPLGRLCLAGYITEKQHDAGQRWADIVRRYAVLVGLPRENPDSPNVQPMSAGLSCIAEPDD